MNTRDLLAMARAAGVKIATAESCTGGLIAAALTEVAGASDVFERGFVTYSNDAKHQMLGVPTQLITDHGAVSEEVAAAMAEGAIKKSCATLAVSVTGIAGPGGSDHKPEGRVCFATAGPDTRTVTVDFGAIGRANVRAASARYALDLLRTKLSQPL